jgi:hypothetical protein
MFRRVRPTNSRRTEDAVPRMPYPGRRFALPWAISLCPFGAGPMVHRRDLQTGHSPILRAERQQRNTVARSSEAVRFNRSSLPLCYEAHKNREALGPMLT